MPRPELALDFGVTGAAGCRRLTISATGDPHAFGCWQGEVDLEDGQWYLARVHVRARDIEDHSLSVLAQVAEHFLVPKSDWSGDTVLEQTFLHRAENGNRIELYMRAAERGQLEWFAPSVELIPKPVHRIARAATVRFGETRTPLTLDDQLIRISEKLDQAGALKPDVVCLPEFCSIIGVPQEQYGSYAEVAVTLPDAPLCKVLSKKARQHNMYVLCGIIERDGCHIFNTAVLLGRDGACVGCYRKTHLTFGELRDGISCGEDYPVFDVDFGRIAVHICYDEWFPEVARLYAHKGAEILFLPVAGGKPITWRTRALDNGIYFVSSAIVPPSMIIDSSGAIIAETHGDGVVFADLNLDTRQINWYGDPTLIYGMPCIVPQMRNVVNGRLTDSLACELRKR